jgi:hypothetical protein
MPKKKKKKKLSMQNFINIFKLYIIYSSFFISLNSCLITMWVCEVLEIKTNLYYKLYTFHVCATIYTLDHYLDPGKKQTKRSIFFKSKCFKIWTYINILSFIILTLILPIYTTLIMILSMVNKITFYWKF